MARSRPSAGEIQWAKEHDKEKYAELKGEESSWEREHLDSVSSEPKGSSNKVTKYIPLASGKVKKVNVDQDQNVVAGVKAYTSKQKALNKALDRYTETKTPYEQKRASVERKQEEETEKKIKRQISNIQGDSSGSEYYISKDQGRKKVTKKKLLSKLNKMKDTVRRSQIQAGAFISESKELLGNIKKMKDRGATYLGFNDGEMEFETTKKINKKSKKQKTTSGSPLIVDSDIPANPSEELSRSFTSQGNLRTAQDVIEFSKNISDQRRNLPSTVLAEINIGGQLISRTPVEGIIVPEEPEVVGAGFEQARALIYDPDKLGAEAGVKSEFFAERPHQIIPALAGEYLWGKALGGVIEEVGGRSLKGIYKLLGKDKIPLEDIANPGLVGKVNNYPKYPSSVYRYSSPDDLLEHFKLVSKSYGAEEYLGEVPEGLTRVWHGTPSRLTGVTDDIASKITGADSDFIAGGGSELDAFYTAPQLSTHFLYLDDTAKASSLIDDIKNTRLPFWNRLRGKRPTIASIDTEVSRIKGLGKGTSNWKEVGKNFLSQANEGMAYLNPEKTEMEAVFRKGQRFVKVSDDFFTTIKGKTVPIQQYKPVSQVGDLTGITDDLIKSGSEILEESSRGSYRSYNPFMPVFSGMPTSRSRVRKKRSSKSPVSEIDNFIEFPTSRSFKQPKRESRVFDFEMPSFFYTSPSVSRSSKVSRLPSYPTESFSILGFSPTQIDDKKRPKGFDYDIPEVEPESMDLFKGFMPKRSFKPSVIGIISGKKTKEPDLVTGFGVRFPEV